MVNCNNCTGSFPKIVCKLMGRLVNDKIEVIVVCPNCIAKIGMTNKFIYNLEINPEVINYILETNCGSKY